jgi:uncharacterized protein (TIGR01777 family)
MNIAITGASGFIGRALVARFASLGHTARGISARSRIAPSALGGCEAVVHLAGEPVAQRWTPAAKERIRKSRIEGTRNVVQAIGAMENKKPAVLVSASAIGYYGSRGDELLTEQSAPGKDFLAEVCIAWEQEAREAEKLGVRVVNPRFGVVLGSAGGALQTMLPAFRLGVGGRIASGAQWMSWIHLDDLVSLIAFAVSDAAVRGPVNATAPNPVTNADFTHQLAQALHRPALIPVPTFALNLLFGEMSSMLVGGQRVIPRAALDAGFRFRYSDLGPALAALFGSQRTSATPNA